MPSHLCTTDWRQTQTNVYLVPDLKRVPEAESEQNGNVKFDTNEQLEKRYSKSGLTLTFHVYWTQFQPLNVTASATSFKFLYALSILFWHHTKENVTFVHDLCRIQRRFTEMKYKQQHWAMQHLHQNMSHIMGRRWKNKFTLTSLMNRKKQRDKKYNRCIITNYTRLTLILKARSTSWMRRKAGKLSRITAPMLKGFQDCSRHPVPLPLKIIPVNNSVVFNVIFHVVCWSLEVGMQLC